MVNKTTNLKEFHKNIKLIDIRYNQDKLGNQRKILENYHNNYNFHLF